MSSPNKPSSTISRRATPSVATAASRRAATQQALTRRQVRAARRERERRRRAAAFYAIIGLVIIAIAVLLLKDHLPFNSASPTASKPVATAQNCPATPAVVGPAPSVPVPQTPPATPPSAQVIDGAQGLKYIDITPGCGTAVKAGDNVTVNYSGWLQSNGKLFDSSLSAGHQPFTVSNVGQAQVITGWNLGLIGMKPGGTRRLIIPPAIGYGSTAQGPIPANSTLVFDVTVLKIG